MNEQQIAWVKRNREPVRLGGCLGQVAAGILEGVSSSTAGHLSQLQRVIGAGTDQAFRRHCTLGSLRNNVLTILVDQESLVCAMRLRWFSALGELIGKQCRGFHVSDIRFQVGCSELTLGSVKTASSGVRHEGQR